MYLGFIIIFPQIVGWCLKQESNLQPAAYEADALPIELFRHIGGQGWS